MQALNNLHEDVSLPPQMSAAQNAILDAALRVFVDLGYEAANMRIIAAESGYSKPTIYANFGSKKGLFEALVSNTCAQIKHPDIEIDETLNARDILVDLAQGYRDNVLSSGFIEFYRLVISEAKRFPGLGAIFYRFGPQASRSSLAKLLLQLSEKKILGPIEHPETAAEQFEALVLEPIKVRAFLLTETKIPPADVDAFVQAAITTFLKAYDA
ncbi:MAG: TetR/AcrR family transcriptional regulator [Halioglobus sp.]